MRAPSPSAQLIPIRAFGIASPRRPERERYTDETPQAIDDSDRLGSTRIDSDPIVQDTTLGVSVDPLYDSDGGDAEQRLGKDERVYLAVALERGAHMPVMDSLLAGGKCDPYCQVHPCCTSLPRNPLLSSPLLSSPLLSSPRFLEINLPSPFSFRNISTSAYAIRYTPSPAPAPYCNLRRPRTATCAGPYCNLRRPHECRGCLEPFGMHRPRSESTLSCALPARIHFLQYSMGPTCP